MRPTSECRSICLVAPLLSLNDRNNNSFSSNSSEIKERKNQFDLRSKISFCWKQMAHLFLFICFLSIFLSSLPHDSSIRWWDCIPSKWIYSIVQPVWLMWVCVDLMCSLSCERYIFEDWKYHQHQKKRNIYNFDERERETINRDEWKFLKQYRTIELRVRTDDVFQSVFRRTKIDHICMHTSNHKPMT